MLSTVFVTGSRKGDLCLIAVFAALMLVAAPFLRVYFCITSFETEWARIGPDGQRSPVDPPPKLEVAKYWNRKPEDLLPVIERRFRKAVAELDGSGDRRYELTVRYSFNSPRRDRTVTWRAP